MSERFSATTRIQIVSRNWQAAPCQWPCLLFRTILFKFSPSPERRLVPWLFLLERLNSESSHHRLPLCHAYYSRDFTSGCNTHLILECACSSRNCTDEIVFAPLVGPLLNFMVLKLLFFPAYIVNFMVLKLVFSCLYCELCLKICTSCQYFK